MYKKLFIPGPTHVREEILQAQAVPMIGHRSKEYSDLQAAVTPKLQQLLYTTQPVFLFASSSTGVMEAAIRNCVAKKCLNTVCGEFSRRWHEITKANGKDCDVLEVPIGKAVLPEMIDEKLATGEYDAVTVVHNETSTGVMNPIEEIAEVMKKYPDVMFLVDSVSSMAGVKIEFDRLGIDVLLAGVQKCFALPPGLTVCAVSHKALKKAETVPYRGKYFDFIDMYKFYQKNQTPATPAISLIQALNKQMDDILAEGLENRWQRHKEMAKYVQDWARKYWALFSDERYLSLTVTNIVNTREVDIKALNEELGRRGAMISDGYGPLKGKCFRVAHMGDLTLDDLRWLTAQIEDILKLS
ncbi:MAG: alanine--glyoxylate aminotransferase family protein [Anaerolineae bacterium]|nr:alanine--glyoxylate aminotransferase family protein [Anaerolineae bacterium]